MYGNIQIIKLGFRKENKMEKESVDMNCVYTDNQENTFKITISIGENEEVIILETEINGKYYKSEAADHFSAFQKLKDTLLESNIGMKCYGSMENVYPSPLMRTSESAYILENGKRALTKDIVNIFDYIEINKFSNSAYQNNYYERWLMSLNSKDAEF
jgi:hypothetical protein